MKLQEAFMERNDIRKKITRLEGDLHSVIITEEHEVPQFNAVEKLNKIVKLEQTLFELNCKIDIANKANVERLQDLKYLDHRIKTYSNIRSILLSWNKKRSVGYGDAIQITQKNLNLGDITTELEALEAARRKTDKELQSANWEIEI